MAGIAAAAASTWKGDEVKDSRSLGRSNNGLLARLPANIFQRLAPALEPVPLTADQVLYEPGDALGHVYFPLDGVVAWLVPMRDGSGVVHSTVGREGVVGVMTLVGFETTIHRAAVQLPGQALRMSADAFRAAALTMTPLKLVLAEYQKAYLGHIAQRVACNAVHSVRQRCCHWLLLMQDRLRTDRLPVTQEMLARSLRVRRATVNTVCRKLQQAGVIESGHGVVSIRDRKEMEAAACECYHVIRARYDRLLW
jgi:CRP-like cAMP-binding protein